MLVLKFKFQEVFYVEEKEEKNENTEPEDLLEETIEIGKEFFGDILNIKEDK